MDSLARNTPGEAPLEELTITDLQNEIRRRAESLVRERDELQDRLAVIEQELQALSPAGGFTAVDRNGVHRRLARALPPQPPLREILGDILARGPLTTAEAAREALAAGYRTRARDFVATVGATLHREDRFVRRSGTWRLVE